VSAFVAVLLPVLAALAVLAPGAGRRAALAVAPWLPLVLLWPAWTADAALYDDVLLGLRLGADPVTRPLIVLCALAWTAAGWFARDRVADGPVLFWGGWLASLSGMALLLLARDLGGLYVGYAVLSLASWLLVVHARSAEARRAGRVYLAMALLGEMAVFAGVAAIVAEAGNAPLSALSPPLELDAHWAWLLFAGYAVKMGVVGVHLWLPLAHPVAPVPASAVLSGVIVKAGLVGWLRLVPPGSGVEAFADALLVLGLATAFGGVALGLAQDRLKVVLAYSTISQMGLVLVGFAALLAGGDPAAAYGWLGVLVLHHGLNKAALFLACGCAPGRGAWRAVLIALPSLALAGAPLTTGVLGKHGLKSMFGAVGLDGGWTLVLSLTSTATALLLWRFWRLARAGSASRPVHPAWVVLTLLAATVPWAWAVAGSLDVGDALTHVGSALWPLALAAALIALTSRAPALQALRVPAGDLVVVLEPVASALARGLGALGGPAPAARLRPSRRVTHTLIRTSERYLRAIPVAGVVILAVGAAMWLLGGIGAAG
jgi:formate hydrogenlyase subunit 3/multisubunit Na+/H+ antiporter MnhD subunit